MKISVITWAWMILIQGIIYDLLWAYFAIITENFWVFPALFTLYLINNIILPVYKKRGSYE